MVLCLILSFFTKVLISEFGQLLYFSICSIFRNSSFMYFSFLYVYMSDYLSKLLVLMDTLYSSISCENSFPLVCLYYSKYCNTSQATSMEKPEKEDENWSWITVNFGSRTKMNQLESSMFTSSPICCLSWSFMKKIAGLTVPPNHSTVCYFVHNNSPVREIWLKAFWGPKKSQNTVIAQIPIKLCFLSLEIENLWRTEEYLGQR